MHNLSIIIVNYQTYKKTNICIDSIFKSRIDIKVDVRVVDNGSTDNSPFIIKKKFPQVHLISNRSNLFYSQANNQALKKIYSKYFLILNSDVKLFPQTLQKMYEFMENNSDCGLCGCRQVDIHGKTLLTTHRSHSPIIQILLLPPFYNFFKNSQIMKRFRYGDWDRGSIKQVDTIPGSFMFGRTKLLNKIGYLDEDMPLFYSDADYCERLRKTGYKICHNGRVKIIHDVSSTLVQFSRLYIEHISYRDMVKYYRKHFGAFWATVIYIFTRFAVICDFYYLFAYFKFTVHRFILALDTWIDRQRLLGIFPQLIFLEAKIIKNYNILEPFYKKYTSNISLDYMAISLETAAFILSFCQIYKPRRIADLGSGFSTFVFHMYAKRARFKVTICSVDDDEHWLKKTRRWLVKKNIKNPDLRKWSEFQNQQNYKFDLILHDLGDMEMRLNTLSKILSMVQKDGFVVLDDLQFREYAKGAKNIINVSNFLLFSLREFTLDRYKRYAGLAIRSS